MLVLSAKVQQATTCFKFELALDNYKKLDDLLSFQTKQVVACCQFLWLRLVPKLLINNVWKISKM